MGAQLQTAPGLLAPGEPVGVAVLARTSTLLLQDPLASLQRQLRNTRAWVPPGWHITGYYWDVESGGIDVEDRSQGDAWREFAAAGIPRDGGIADLMREASGPAPAFTVVVCEEIERSARDSFNSLKIERELRDQGIMLCATDEPFDIKGVSPTTILVRRVKQGVAEWFRLHLREQTWEGLVTHALDGYHVGPAPYGYLADRVPHPIASKAAQGRTKTRLALDPARAPVVAQIFTWRTIGKLSVRGIAARLQARPALYPPWSNGGWTEAHVDKILRNPKYTGHMVYGRTRGRSQGQARSVPREQWIWSPKPTHPEIIPLETWEAAQLVGEANATSRDDSDGDGVTITNRDRTYPLRSRVRCRACNRRMCGNTYTKLPSPRRPDGTTYIYYLCPHDKTNPRHHAAHPDHPRVSVRQDALTAVITGFFAQRVFGSDRAAMLAAQLPATAADQARQLDKEATRLRKRLRRIDNAENNTLAELDATTGDNTAAIHAYRARLRARFVQQEEERATINTQLAKIAAQQGHTANHAPDLLDDLPTLTDLLPHTPERILDHLIEAFDIQCLYNSEDHQVTIRAVLTDTTPHTLAALINDAEPPTPTSHPTPPDNPVGDLPYGPIYTVAGGNPTGFSGDGGPATSAELGGPFGVAVDGPNLLIGDSGNNRIREVAG